MNSKILQTYLRRLTNLSGSNKLLMMLRMVADQDLDISALDYLSGQSTYQVLSQLIEGKDRVMLCAEMDSRNNDVNAASAQLKKIARKVVSLEEERGTKDLYVGYPFVHGQLADGTLVRCPLLFFPVDLLLENNHWLLKPRNDEQVQFNKSFLLAYAHYNQVSLPDDLIDYAFDASGEDSLSFRTTLYNLLKESALEINFNQDLFKNELQAFRPYKKADFEADQAQGKLKLFSEAVLGVFPQADSYLVPDYHYLLENQVDFDQIMLGSPDNAPSLPIKEEQIFAPFALDASQEQALVRCKSGQSLVVQGPPGTGKSQLICNLVADYMARGKKVLVVCQKRAALDVVYNRLSGHGLKSFLALVHDFKHDRKSLYDQLASQIDAIDTYKNENSSLDAIYLERNFTAASRQIDKLAETLDSFKKALFDTSECGLSVKELYLNSDNALPRVDLQAHYKQFDYLSPATFGQVLARYFEYVFTYAPDSGDLQERVNFSNMVSNDLREMLLTIEEVVAYRDKIETVGSLERAHYLVQQANEVEALLVLLEDTSVFDNFLHLIDNPKTDPHLLQRHKESILALYQPPGVFIYPPDSIYEQLNINNIYQIVAKAADAQSAWLKRTMYSFFDKDKKAVQAFLEANALQWQQTNVLLQKVQHKIKLEEEVEKIQQEQIFAFIPKSREKAHWEQWFATQEKALHAKAIWEKIGFQTHEVAIRGGDFGQIEQEMLQRLTACKKINQAYTHWLKYLAPKQIQKLLAQPAYAQRLTVALKKDFDALVEFDKMTANFTATESAIVQTLRSWAEANQVQDAAWVAHVFTNSLALAWIDHIEQRYPILRAVSTPQLKHIVEEMQTQVKNKQEISDEILRMRAKESTYKHINYNRLQKRTTYRELHHQVTKKRKIWPVRKLVANFPNEVFDLIPCWLASPEVVSAVFPMEKLFDLVIFDEASQCFAEKGLPAMYRGRQMLVAGDDKQLKPHNLYLPRWDEAETDDLPELEIDSLLNLAEQYLPQLQLTGHYRSKSMDLIDFSNQYFYNRTLKVMPHFTDINTQEPSIRYIKTEGIWENNQNIADAEATVDLVIELIGQQPDKSLGIVTFNSSQQTLIMDKLEAFVAARATKLPEHLFVKNIENVQGDERDIIIFSVAYAPDAKGVLRVQFGSLSMQGGENRLNVAVTRAREKVYVVSSIWPHQLKTEETLNEGPKLLKKYLEYALHVSEGNFRPQPAANGLRKQQNMLYDKLMQLNPHLVRELPFADLTLKKGAAYAGLVLTDDDLLYQSVSAKDAHVYLPFGLIAKQWPFAFFYSREYWVDKKAATERLENIR